MPFKTFYHVRQRERHSSAPSIFACDEKRCTAQNACRVALRCALHACAQRARAKTCLPPPAAQPSKSDPKSCSRATTQELMNACQILLGYIFCIAFEYHHSTIRCGARVPYIVCATVGIHYYAKTR